MSRPPRVKLDHLEALTDDTGLIQHAVHSVAKRETGYATDDNARALVVTAREANGRQGPLARELAHVYLAFLTHAQRQDGLFHNFMAYDRSWLDEAGSPDCQGRVAWACAEVLTSDLPAGFKRVARELLARLEPHLSVLTSPRAVALALIALTRLPAGVRRSNDDRPANLARFLLDRYQSCRHDDWHWFEEVLTYANARLPEGMLAAAALTGNRTYLEVGLESLKFLAEVTIRDDTFVPIGNRRWYARGAQRSEYDQQPIEACCMVAAAMAAWRATGRSRYRTIARCALDWFAGRNTLGEPVADPKTGACRDGINEDGLNTNEGAESTLAYLLALQDYAKRA